MSAEISVNYSLSNGNEVSIEYNGTIDTYGLEFSPIYLDFDEDGTNDLTTIAYCVELDQPVSNGDTYHIDLVTAVGNYLGAAWIMDNYSGSGDATQNAAVQIAIWETVYDGIGGAFDTGSFKFTSVPVTDEIYQLAEQYITELTTASLTGLERYKIAQNADKQDLLVSTVPIPAAVWLFTSGLIGFVGLGRRWKFS